MDKAIYGLIGVVLGFLLTVFKDFVIQRRKNQKDIEYLCIHVIFMLDRFVSSCSEVVGDDGLCHGQPDADGYHRAQVSAPDFEPQKLSVEWKSLPTKIMYEVLNFPLLVENAQAAISAEFEYCATPPDYSEGFEERQYQYAILGIKASELASKLRALSKLPQRDVTSDKILEHLMARKIKIEDLREKRQMHHLQMISQSMPNPL
ncbi:hypothetical protein [Rheinheimera sp. 1928-s]|uniref:hypothetical protein n=1 Tax=Rheinheimera sp. 1928-s TaxID=3033803 RepID=UPI002626EA36|nr:hypothetical protein [Rheinheimera sp. 1928-s]MDF3125560.1 hypothetical protein [Rheinheimera sp. 1928-s]